MARKLGSGTLRYANAIAQAALLHSAAKRQAKRIERFLTRCEQNGLRQPDEWIIQWGGTPQFRWHDGKCGYSGSKGEVTVTLSGGYDEVPATCDIGGSLDRKSRGYSENRTNITGLSEDGALTILAVLIQVLDVKDSTP